MRSSIVVAALILLVILPSVSSSEVLGTAEYIHESCCWSWDGYNSKLLLRLTIGEIMPEFGYWPWDVEFPDLLNDTDGPVFHEEGAGSSPHRST